MRNFLVMLLVALPAIAHADMGDMGSDMPTDVGSDMAADMAADMAIDVGADASIDIGTDMAADVGTDTATDVSVDASEMLFTFSGTVTLDGAADSGAVDVRITNSDTNRQTYTDIAGTFAFTGLPDATYQVDIGFPGYLSVSDTVNLRGDISRSYVLTPETTHVVKVDITFEEAAPAELVIDGSRAALSVSETVTVSGGKASWEPALVEGTWNVNLSAAGYQTRQLAIDATKEGRQYNVLMTVEPPRGYEVTSDCGCRSVQAKHAMPLSLVAFLLGALVWRRRA